MTVSISLIFPFTGMALWCTQPHREWWKIHLRPNFSKLPRSNTLVQEKEWFQTNFSPILPVQCREYSLFWSLYHVSISWEHLYVWRGWKQWFSALSLHGNLKVFGWLLDGPRSREKEKNRGLRGMKFLLYKPFHSGEKQLFYLNNMGVFKP